MLLVQEGEACRPGMRKRRRRVLGREEANKEAIEVAAWEGAVQMRGGIMLQEGEVHMHVHVG
jgi:hypothetical protein